MRHTTSLLLIIATLALSGCASNRSTSDNAIGGVIVGGFAGGAIGTLCCGVVGGLPAGILIGGAVGGLGGMAWPNK